MAESWRECEFAGTTEQVVTGADTWYWQRFCSIAGMVHYMERCDCCPVPALAAANADAERLVREKKAVMDGLPQTVKEAVRVLYAMMEPDEIEEALKQTVDDAWRYHHGVGRSIRNRMGLWSGNVALLTDCGYPPGSTDVPADEASGVIIRELIRYVHSLHEEEMILALDANRSLRECDLHGKYTGIALVVGPCHVLIRPRLAAHEVLLKGEAGV